MKMDAELEKRILKISLELQKELKKKGKGFKHTYFRTEDILPAVVEKCLKYDITFKITFEDGYGIIVISRTDRENSEKSVQKLPLTVSSESNPEKSIQLVGKMHTYYRRYLLILAFNVCEVDEIELINPDKPTKKYVKPSFVTNDELKELYDKLIKQCHGNYDCFESKVETCFDNGYVTEDGKKWLYDNFKSGGVNM